MRRHGPAAGLAAEPGAGSDTRERGADRFTALVRFVLLAGMGAALSATGAAQEPVAAAPFGLRVVDEATGRGVPLVRLTTTGNIECWTDSEGWIAFQEPGLMNREVFFQIDSPGYEVAPDGFGFRGVRVETKPGGRITVKTRRTQPAERMYRATGQGIFRDAELLGEVRPANIPALNGGVIGCDSVQAVVYRNRVFWLWGDTNLPHYPLGNFHVTAATTPLPGRDGFDPERGVPLQYFLEPDGQRVKAMLPDEQPGPVWLFGLFVVNDERQQEVLLAHYSRHLKLDEMVEHGVARYDDGQQVFRKLVTFEADNPWRHPRGNAVRVSDAAGDWICFCEPFATVRVPARLDAVLEPAAWQAFAWDEAQQEFAWQSVRPPATQAEETARLATGFQPASAARFQLRDRATGDSVEIHRASINWNEFRQRWILIGNQVNATSKPSHFGEVWYAEAADITGPWTVAARIATHPGWSFYNPRHHTFLDSEDGRMVWFEGTFTRTFSGNPLAVPRYEYNQLMYRLDLSGDWLDLAD